MLPSQTLVTLLVAAATTGVLAAPAPLTPGTANAGSTCSVPYTPDTTGTWTDVTITFMTGDNWNMVPLTTVATGVDCTADSTVSWTCPEVDPYAAIYFYQFEQASESPTWTTRFAIASPEGDVEDAPESTQPNGDAIPWGTGSLVGGSSGAASSGAATTGSTSSAATDAASSEESSTSEDSTSAEMSTETSSSDSTTSTDSATYDVTTVTQSQQSTTSSSSSSSLPTLSDTTGAAPMTARPSFALASVSLAAMASFFVLSA